MNFRGHLFLIAIAFSTAACVTTRPIPPGTYVSQSTAERIVIYPTTAYEKALLDLRLRTNETEGQKTAYRGRFNYWLQPDQTFLFFNGSSASAFNLGRYKWSLHGQRLTRRSLWPQDQDVRDTFILQ